MVTYSEKVIADVNRVLCEYHCDFRLDLQGKMTMTVAYSAAVANACLDQWETSIGATAILRIYTGAPPANCATAASGTKLVDMTLPADWMAAASGGSKSKSGTWQDASADDTGTAGYYRIYESTGTTCHEQGTVTVTGGGGDMTLNSVDITATQEVTITGYDKTMNV